MERQRRHEVDAGKKIRPTVREPNCAQFLLRCAQLGLSDGALGGMDVGMVYDLLIERDNDSHEYPYKATKEDIDKYFG